MLFFISGVAALIYQVCWQRLLFQTFGVDMESVTIIVSTFMFGLGRVRLRAGSALTAFRIKHWRCSPHRTGDCSLWRRQPMADSQRSARRRSRVPLAAIALVNFLLLLFPTMLMGATLPILVTHVMRHYRNIGVSIGLLYFANTLGAALGAALTGMLVLYYFGASATIHVAVALNVVVSRGLVRTAESRCLTFHGGSRCSSASSA